MSSAHTGTRQVQSVRLVLEGDLIEVRYRTSDDEAVDRGEKVFLEYFQSAHDFAVTFELPEHRDALRFLLETGKFCEFHRRFVEIWCENLPKPNRTSYAHEGVFGVLDLPDQWEASQLPEDWPEDELESPEEEGEAASEDQDQPLQVYGGAAAACDCLHEARLAFADGSHEDWHPTKPVEIHELLGRWPDLRALGRPELGACPSWLVGGQSKGKTSGLGAQAFDERCPDGAPPE